MKYKVGDKVFVIAKKHTCFSFGEELIVLKVDIDGDCYCSNGKDKHYVMKHRLKLKIYTMKKSDLNTGMLVERRSGILSRVFLDSHRADCFVNDDETWSGLDFINENLTHKTEKQWDIVKVYKPSTTPSMVVFDTSRHTLLWQRETVVEVTVKMNGKEVDPKTLSKKTWKGLQGKD